MYRKNIARRHKPAQPKRSLMKVFWLCLAAIVTLAAADVLRYAVWPDVDDLVTAQPQTTALIEQRRGEAEDVGRTFRVRRTWVPLKRISPHLIRAVTIAEDDKFWGHEGFDVDGMEDALRRNLEKGRLAAGGSTITQQLAKNLYLGTERSLSRKLKEAILAIRLEEALSKRRILELYLNVVEWGDGIFGAEEAARAHFGVAAANLSPEQSARLAAVLPNPRKWSARNPPRHIRQKTAIILSRMERRGLI